MKNPIFTFVIVALIGGSIWLWYQSAGKIEQPSNNFVENQEKTIPPSVTTNAATPSIQLTDINEDAKEAKSTIQTNNNTQTQSVEIYNQLFQIAGMQNGYAENVTSGTPIHVTNFDDASIAPSVFSPLMANGKIVAISIFREFTPGKSELARMRNVTEDWTTYPPISVDIAQQSLLTQYPNLAFTHTPGYYYLEDRETPFHLFENDTGTEKHFYLISALDDKNIQIRMTRGQNNQAEEIPVRLNASGLIEIDELKVANMTEDQLEQLRKEIAITNKYIQDGIMQFDEDMNLIFDKRAN